MTVNKILEMGLADDHTEIFIRDGDSRVLAHGNWHQDDILGYGDREVESSILWHDECKLYINVR